MHTQNRDAPQHLKLASSKSVITERFCTIFKALLIIFKLHRYLLQLLVHVLLIVK